jgi:hypothetical protein
MCRWQIVSNESTCYDMVIRVRSDYVPERNLPGFPCTLFIYGLFNYVISNSGFTVWTYEIGG